MKMEMGTRNLLLYLTAATALTIVILKEDYRTNESIEDRIEELRIAVEQLTKQVKECQSNAERCEY